MVTKWDPLVLKYQRQNQQELGRLTELRRHLKEIESNRDKVAERQTHFRRQLHTNTLREIDDWRVMKSFLADLDVLRNNCEGQLIEIRELIVAPKRKTSARPRFCKNMSTCSSKR